MNERCPHGQWPESCWACDRAMIVRLAAELAEARELLLLVRDKGFDYWRQHELARRLNAFLAATAPKEGER